MKRSMHAERASLPAQATRKVRTQHEPARLPRVLQLVLETHIGSAAQALNGRRAPSDDAIHAARKHLKRARALLRLLRPELGDTGYRRENAALRDVARALSGVRDAVITQTSLETVRGRVRSGSTLGRLEHRLRSERLRVRRDVLDYRKRAALVHALEAAQQRIARRRFALADGLLIDSLRRLYRKGRKAVARACAEPSDALLHEARKQVKYLELGLDALGGPKRPRRVSRAIETTKSIEEDLGRGRDLAVLRSRVEPMLATAGRSEKAILARIARHQRELEARALKRGNRFYAARPKRFARHVKPVAHAT